MVEAEPEKTMAAGPARWMDRHRAPPVLAVEPRLADPSQARKHPPAGRTESPSHGERWPVSRSW